MDEALLHEKFESLRRCVRRVEQKTPPSSDELAKDIDAQDIVVLNLQRAVQVCVDIAAQVISELEVQAPSTMAATFTALQETGVLSPATSTAMIRATGFRNIAVHAYTRIDWQIVHRICTERLDDFRQFAREVDGWASSDASPGRRGGRPGQG